MNICILLSHIFFSRCLLAGMQLENYQINRGNQNQNLSKEKSKDIKRKYSNPKLYTKIIHIFALH